MLYQKFLKAAKLWRPKAIVMENVPGMRTVAGRNIASDVAREMKLIGYRAGYVLLNSAWYGVPQFHERLFFIAFREDLDIEPVAPPITHVAKNFPP